MTAADLTWAQDLPPLDTRPLFRPLLLELLSLLRTLKAEDWEQPTVAGSWKIRDVVAHLIDGDLRKIAVYRDGHRLPIDAPIRSDEDLARLVNGLNASGVAYGSRLSPHLLADLSEISGSWAATLIEGLNPEAPSLFAVSWAGELASLNWMDTGREYTERWHHQMQIRDAVGASRLLAPQWMEPLIEMSLRVLPVAYAKEDIQEGTTITLDVVGPTAGRWTVLRQGSTFRVVRGAPENPSARVQIGADDFWRVFYNASKSPGLLERVVIEGERALAEPMLKARSVIL